MSNPNSEYLGDGLYASDDGFHIVLTTDDHTVYLDSRVLDELFRFVEKVRGVKITVSKAEGRKP